MFNESRSFPKFFRNCDYAGSIVRIALAIWILFIVKSRRLYTRSLIYVPAVLRPGFDHRERSRCVQKGILPKLPSAPREFQLISRRSKSK